MQVLCIGLQEQVTGGAYRERVMQALCSGLQEQVTGGTYRESVMQALCTGLHEQVTGSAYRERDASAVQWPAGTGYWRRIQRAKCKRCALACRSRLLAVHTESVMQVLCIGLQEQVTDGAYRERESNASIVQEQVTGSACRESVMQALCTGLQEQVTGSAYREQVLCIGLQEQVIGSAYRERE
ncbi:hypothetical protein NDU88_006991 [Pleurodeles waltl]|uniref:Uncharacterized protein n=1 Tax=Pleurodeles waltl TaxID=8319 RepID=A0AAV7MHE1_PLEWA|nr:hypothetical protein NDU88_006991 [Pleurodeles waltl]